MKEVLSGSPRLVGPAEAEWLQIVAAFRSRASGIVGPGIVGGPPEFDEVFSKFVAVVVRSLDRIEIRAARKDGELQIEKGPEVDGKTMGGTNGS